MPQPIQFLILVVAVDVAIAAILRLDRTAGFLAGDRGWLSWLGIFAAVYLLVVAYAILRVTRDSLLLRGAVHRGESALLAHARTTNDWLWETTPGLAITYSSHHIQDMLGYHPDDVVGRDAHDFMTPSTARRSRDALISGLARQGWRDIPSEWLHANGSVVAISHSGEPLTDARGRLLGYRGSGSVMHDQEEARYAAETRERVRQVLDDMSLTMALQPIIDIATGRLVAVEALARFNDGRSPDLWFEQAGKVGLRAELELLAVVRALARVTELPDDVSLSINACPDVIIDPRFRATLVDCGVPLNRLVVEITEHIRVEEYSTLEAVVTDLRSLGVRLAVDDTGAGYASLAHVLRLRPDIIKLDRSIVSGLDADGARRALVTALVLLALDIGAVVTAEGVETTAELEAVAALGVDHAQGYLIAKPALDVSTWPSSIRRSAST